MTVTTEGGFDKWDKLKAVLEIRKLSLEVGWLDKSTYPDGTPVAYVAAIHEHGYAGGNIPPRPFIRLAIGRNRVKWKNTAQRGSRALLKGKASPDEVMAKLGLMVEGDIRRSLAKIRHPPLSVATKAARARKRDRGEPVGSLTKPLIETERLIQTLTHAVVST